MQKHYIILLASLLIGCDGEQPAPVEAPPAKPSIEIPDAPPPTIKKLEWTGDFGEWADVELKSEEKLPKCSTEWRTSPLDDEFVIWKCSDFDLSHVSQGNLAIHTRDAKVFMITVSVDYPQDAEFKAATQALIEVNQARSIQVPDSLKDVATHIWETEGFVSLLSVGKKGYSRIYLKSIKDSDILLQLMKRQGAMSKVNKRYRIGDFNYKLTNFEKRRFVGRGAQRWEAKQSSEFVVIEYKIRNMSRTLQQDDPASVTLLGGQVRLKPDLRAEQAFLGADRTGRYLTPLKYRKERQRAHVFEVESKDMEHPLILVISMGDQKLVYKLDLRENQ